MTVIDSSVTQANQEYALAINDLKTDKLNLYRVDESTIGGHIKIDYTSSSSQYAVELKSTKGALRLVANSGDVFITNASYYIQIHADGTLTTNCTLGANFNTAGGGTADAVFG